MYDIRAILGQNLLLIKLEGEMTSYEIKQGTDLLISEAKKLKKGYTIINDASKMKPASPEGAEEILRGQSFIIQTGVGKIIRIAHDPLTKRQLRSTSDQAGYTAIEACSIDEAFELLWF